MPVNKLALIRYHTIDACLSNRQKKWTLEDLIDRVSDALYEYEGINSGVSKRTIQADMQLMRSDKLGYNAPIIVRQKKYYTYERADFSISKLPMNAADYEKLRDVVRVLRQFSAFEHFNELQDTLAKLENRLMVSAPQQRALIQFEHNRQLRGLEHLQNLYQNISRRRVVEIAYKSFRSAEAHTYTYHPYLLKEYRNRWFLLARRQEAPNFITLALDRIEAVREAPDTPYIAYDGQPFEAYFSDVIGITKQPDEQPADVILRFALSDIPYILTKPLHHSQQVLAQDDNSITISIRVVQNFELEREILGYGETVTVLAPASLVENIRRRIADMGRNYQV